MTDSGVPPTDHDSERRETSWLRRAARWLDDLPGLIKALAAVVVVGIAALTAIVIALQDFHTATTHAIDVGRPGPGGASASMPVSSPASSPVPTAPASPSESGTTAPPTVVESTRFTPTPSPPPSAQPPPPLASPSSVARGTALWSGDRVLTSSNVIDLDSGAQIGKPAGIRPGTNFCPHDLQIADNATAYTGLYGCVVIQPSGPGARFAELGSTQPGGYETCNGVPASAWTLSVGANDFAGGVEICVRSDVTHRLALLKITSLDVRGQGTANVDVRSLTLHITVWQG